MRMQIVSHRPGHAAAFLYLCLPQTRAARRGIVAVRLLGAHYARSKRLGYTLEADIPVGALADRAWRQRQPGYRPSRLVAEWRAPARRSLKVQSTSMANSLAPIF